MRCGSEALKRAQRAFLDDLEAEDGGDPAERVLRFDSPPRGTVEERWHVYAHGHRRRIVDLMRQEYPAVLRVLGREAFDAVAGRYLAARPPAGPGTGDSGDGLGDFLATHPLSRGLPFLADLARLERAVSEAFVAGDAEPFRWADLARLGRDAALAARLALVPGARVIRSPWPVLDIWESRFLPPEEVAVELEGRPAVVLVRRQGFRVRATRLEPDVAELAEALAAPSASGGGATLGRLASPAARTGSPASGPFVEALRELLSLDVVTRVDERMETR